MTSSDDSLNAPESDQRADLQLNPDGSIRDLNGFAEITDTLAGSERQVRLAVRFRFWRADAARRCWRRQCHGDGR